MMTMRTRAICILLFFACLHYGTSENQNIVEVTFIVEPQVVRDYQNLGYTTVEAAKAEIEADVNYLFLVTQNMFKSLPSSTSLGIRIKKIQFTTYDVIPTSDSTNGAVLDETALDLFKSWLTKHKISHAIEYDLAVLFTGYELAVAKRRKKYASVAYEKSVCTKDGIIIIQFRGIVHRAKLLAKALGAALGASNDGDGNTCNYNDGYIMSNIYKITNVWKFSTCSQRSIADFVTNLSNSCLKKTTAKPSSFSWKDVKDMDIVNPNVFCQRQVKDKSSHFCMVPRASPTGENIDDICHNIRCYSGLGKDGCLKYYFPPDGMICGENKRCNLGKCEAAQPDFPTPPNLNPRCLFNDILPDMCKALEAKNEWGRCYDDYTERMCCKTCEKGRTTIKGCEFGDKYTYCANETLSLSYRCNDDNNGGCCKTCQECN